MMINRLLSAAVIISLSGCSTILYGKKQTVKILTTPEKATVKIDGKEKGKTPLSITLSRKHDHMIELEKPGYRAEKLVLSRKLNGWFFGNFFLLNFFWVGMIVDAVTGAMWSLSPEHLVVTLSPLSESVPQGEVSVKKKWYIAVLDFESAEGMGRKTAELLSEIVRTYLTDQPYFIVVDRSNMNLILKEQGFQLSDCTGSECSVRVGRLLGVEKMVIGSLGRLGEAFIVTLQVIDVETARIETAVEGKCDTCEPEDLPEMVKECAHRLVKKFLARYSNHGS